MTLDTVVSIMSCRWTRCQHPGTRHRGLFQHRWAAVQGHTARGRCQVCRRGQGEPKKALGLEAISFHRVYVAKVAFGANMNQTVQALKEAEAFPGTSLVIAYSPVLRTATTCRSR